MTIQMPQECATPPVCVKTLVAVRVIQDCRPYLLGHSSSLDITLAIGSLDSMTDMEMIH